MARRQSKSNAEHAADELFGFLSVVPTWVGPIVAGSVYLIMRFLVPAIMSTAGETVGHVFSNVSLMVAPWLALAVIVIWIFAEIRKLGNRRLLDTRSDINSLRALSWQEFERLVGEAYRRRGYVVHETGGGGADGGVDLVLEKNGEKSLVQCKQWKSWKVGVRAIRELYGVVTAENAARGTVVCCGRYTKDARAFAENKPLDLVDGAALWDIIEQVKKDAEDSHDTAEEIRAQPSLGQDLPSCPKCGSQMRLRTASKGRHAGSQFYGCSKFPECRGVRQLKDGT